MKKFLFAAAGLAFVNIATAQSTIEGDATLNNLSLEKAVVTEPGEDSPKKPLELGGVQISGYVDGYWQTKLNQPNTDVQDRSFYTGAEEFALGNVAVTFSKEMGKAGFVGQVGFGSRTDQANFNRGVYELEDDNGDVSEFQASNSFNIQQLYAYYNLTDKLTATAGRFGTFIGYEVVDAPSNFHYSTSNLFQNGPFFHTGVKLDYDLGNGLTAMAGVFNPTDFESIDENENYFFGGQLGYSVDESNVFLNVIHGDTDDTATTQLDLVADTTVSDLYLALNGSYFMANPEAGKDAAWYGVAGYAQYGLTEEFSGGVRVEYMNNEDNLIRNAADTSGRWGDKGSVFAVTASAPYSKDGFTFIPEVRFDIAENDVYTGKNVGDSQSSQITVGAAVNYAF